MSGVADYARLRELGGPVVGTRQAAAAWGVDGGTARRRLRSLVDAGLATYLRRGLWSLDTHLDPFALAPHLTAPLPAYVTGLSALAAHAMIEQIPGRISLASLDRSRRISTSVAEFEIHHLAPELFGGFAAPPRGGFLASPEKALFDLVYLRAAAGGRAYLPELEPPEDFDPGVLRHWTERIAGARLRTIVTRRLEDLAPAPVG
jgi:predicted transcriptional regulator of viral defense system